MGGAKTLVMLAARDGRAAAVAEQLDAEAARLARELPPGFRVTGMTRVPDDPFARFQPPMRGFDAALELAGGDAPAAALPALDGLAARFDACVHADLSGAFAGRVHTVVAPEPTPFRYLYLMRRKAGTSHADYLDHYVNVHAEFGRRTPATRGYEQFHLDADASRTAAHHAGLGLWGADSVSELSLPSVEDFVQAVAISPVATEGPADELNFVDRPNSVGQCMEVRLRVASG